jgi:hypothetical protein
MDRIETAERTTAERAATLKNDRTAKQAGRRRVSKAR